ncbi:VOC family protein [Bradyrhizobium sp. YR681]|uniref:VOC family protein n=1 Tax=Bradyrhizobium sp. YR681 TaxID=1144344 RepID=UPI0009DAF2B0|nr:VOC family protein [Bradyrhizobium sp. YR681]
MATIRCIVRDVEDAINFYRDQFSFELIQQFGPAMAIMRAKDLELWLAGPLSSAAKTISHAVPSGWTRIVIQTDDIEGSISSLKSAGVKFATNLIEGPGGRQAVCEDPSGNQIELFEPRG